MPPFPFPKELFPPGTFPPGMKFSTDFHMPPAVEELLESGGPDALAAMMAAADAPAGTSSFAFGGSDDDEWEDAGDAGGGHRGGSRSARSRRSSRRAGAGPGSGSGSSRRRRGGRGGFPGFGAGGFFGMDDVDGMDDGMDDVLVTFGEDAEAGAKDRGAAESVENDRAYVRALDEEEIRAWADP